jgi:hypothetical protein
MRVYIHIYIQDMKHIHIQTHASHTGLANARVVEGRVGNHNCAQRGEIVMSALLS